MSDLEGTDVYKRQPLVKYLLLTEAEGHEMTNQEYLDRQDEYNMTFFLDESMKSVSYTHLTS